MRTGVHPGSSPGQAFARKRTLAALDRDSGRVEGCGDIADLLLGRGTAGFAQAKREFRIDSGAQVTAPSADANPVGPYAGKS